MNRESWKDKDLKNTYLRVGREGKYGEQYEEILLYKNKIAGLIPFYELEEDGEGILVYALNFQNSFLENLSDKRMGCVHIENMMHSLIQIMLTLDEYLLDPSNLVLEMDHIYGKDSKWSFVYIPGYQEDFWKQMEKLSEEWLNYVDYGSETAVLWAYTFYQKVHNRTCSVEELSSILKLQTDHDFYKEKDTTDQEQTKTEEKEIKNKVVPEKSAASNKESTSQKIKKWFGKINIKGKRKKESADFYDWASPLQDTLPEIKTMDKISEKDSKKKKMFTLIPLGENEMKVIYINKFPAVLGRAEGEADIYIANPKISRLHAKFEKEHQNVKIIDMNSSNGTCRNGECLESGKACILHAGDILKLADLEFICQWC